MPLTVTLNPNVSTWSLGDPVIGVTATGAIGGAGTGIFWESNNGTFANRFVASTNFTPNNTTKLTTIKAREIINSSYGGVSNVSISATYGGTKAAGSNSDWDAHVFYTSPVAYGVSGTMRFEAAEVTYEKAGGFIANGTYDDPTIVNDDPNVTFTFAWHLLGNGTAIARKQGRALTVPIPYKVGDSFEITLDRSSAIYYMNGVVVASTIRPSSNSQYAYLAFKNVGASLDAFVYQPDMTQVGSSTVNVIGVLPVNPNYSYELTNDNITAISTAEDGSLFFRKRGNAKKGFSLSFNQRSFNEYDSLAKFWRAHDRIERFIYRDIPTSQSYLVRFESGLQTTIESPDVITVQASIKEI